MSCKGFLAIATLILFAVQPVYAQTPPEPNKGAAPSTPMKRGPDVPAARTMKAPANPSQGVPPSARVIAAMHLREGKNTIGFAGGTGKATVIGHASKIQKIISLDPKTGAPVFGAEIKIYKGELYICEVEKGVEVCRRVVEINGHKVTWPD